MRERESERMLWHEICGSVDYIDAATRVPFLIVVSQATDNCHNGDKRTKKMPTR